MAWVVDTCVILDVLEGDPEHGERSAALIDKSASGGLLVCPVTYIELAPAFGGDRSRQEYFLDQINIGYRAEWTRLDTETAHAAFHRYIQMKRGGKAVKRPVADVQIGAFACRFGGLLTRNPDNFRAVFLELAMKP